MDISLSSSIYNAVKEVKNVPEFKEKIESAFQKNITELFGIILGGAIGLRASDIHIEPREKTVRLRLRIDGILQDVVFISPKIYHSLLSRVKFVSGLKLNVSDRPQDGRFSIIQEERKIETRVSTLPSDFGESIVMRLLDPKSLIEVEDLGLRKDLLEIFKKQIKKPNGMILVTGPTGSGKTTTLYAFLKRIQNPEIKIITIEDPIEYKLKGITQTQVNHKKGYDFASGLRALMRQDPDVILVGEIRDLETAEIACEAALTGHLVLSTLHTNDAAGAVARLVDIGVRPISIAPAINMAVAQRLVRRVCKKCVKYVNPSKEESEKIKKGLAGVRKEIVPPSFFNADFKIPKIQGCPDCNFTGYRGRSGIYEAFLVDDEMKEFILSNPSITATRNLAIKKGMVLMHQDGLIKVLEGVTTIEEVERVTGE